MLLEWTVNALNEEQTMKVWAYVFITTSTPRLVVQAIRKIDGVAQADALFGTPDAIAIVEGEDIATMDTVIDRIVEVPGVHSTDTKVARWID
jgi:DNA-binding Lrp family transcriptional regulator